jgi:uncharacterized membrane protein
MSKNRIEALTDGVFAIVMTLLVLDLRPPEGAGENSDLWRVLGELGPHFASYFITFVVVAMFWMMHHLGFHYVIERVDRVFLPIALAYLCFLSLLPFSAQLLGTHPETRAAAIVYGLNVLAISGASLAMFTYGANRPGIGHPLEATVFRQARLRQWIIPVCAMVGIAATWLWIPLALFFYAFPVVFNLVPGLAGAIERRVVPVEGEHLDRRASDVE